MGCILSKRTSPLITCRKCKVNFYSDSHLYICDICLCQMTIEEKLDYIQSIQFLNKDVDESCEEKQENEDEYQYEN